MPYALDDTIAAVASPPGGAARGILRLSGPRVLDCLRACFEAVPHRDLSAVTRPTAVAGRLQCDDQPPRLPGELYLWPRARSYTAQPVAELHTLGSPPLLAAVLARICRAGARLAEPGEFTLRAFLAGRIDLTQAEAVLGVIDAAEPEQLDAALEQLAGGLARPLEQLRRRLLELLAELEAGFDFPDEDLPRLTADVLGRELGQAGRAVARLVRQIERRTESAPAARVVLVGAPNAGKSSLFNALARGPQALVSDQPRTTRDYLVAELDLDGLKCRLVDTAGVEPSGSAGSADLEQAAQQMTSRQARGSQLRLLCIDAGRPMNQWERSQLRDPSARQLVVLTKIDRPRQSDCPRYDVATSSASGEGLDALRRTLRQALVGTVSAHPGGVAGTADRCRESLRRAAQDLARARIALRRGRGEELLAVEIRSALDELGHVVGAVYTDDVLEVIFSRFCIGK